jgi:hypothetical protein
MYKRGEKVCRIWAKNNKTHGYYYDDTHNQDFCVSSVNSEDDFSDDSDSEENADPTSHIYQEGKNRYYFDNTMVDTLE